MKKYLAHAQSYGHVLAIALVLVCSGAAYGWYTMNAELVQRSAEIDSLTAKVSELTAEKQTVSDALEVEKSKNAEFDSQIKHISSTVGTLQTLANTDPQFLAKYSKVYFLNQNYAPEHLKLIDPKYRFRSAKELYFQSKVMPHLEDLLDDAEDDGIDLKVESAYRSYGTQEQLKGSYTVRYGSGANAFSADQGYSEHQLGTTVDFTTKTLGGALAGFDKQPAYAWLQKNAWKYGFILSYPANNTHYIFEPWHWRYVGVNLAEHLHDENKQFNELDQREINEYLVSFFD